MVHIFRIFVTVIAISVSTPAVAVCHPSYPTLKEELSHKPIAYGLAGIGGLVSFISFSGLFAGGSQFAICDDPKRRQASETIEQCRERISASNDKFYEAMAYTFAGGIGVTATGVAMICWGGRRDDQVILRLQTGPSNYEVSLSRKL